MCENTCKDCKKCEFYYLVEDEENAEYCNNYNTYLDDASRIPIWCEFCKEVPSIFSDWYDPSGRWELTVRLTYCYATLMFVSFMPRKKTNNRVKNPEISFKVSLSVFDGMAVV